MMPRTAYRTAFRRAWRGLLFTGTLAALLAACDGPAPAHSPAGSAGQLAEAVAPTPVADSAALAARDSSRLLAPGCVGRLRVGMRVGELRQRYGELLRAVTLRRGTGADQVDIPAFTLGRTRTPDGELPAVLLEPLCRDGEDHPDGSVSDHCRIWRLTVRDPAYRTASGVGPGSRYGDLKLAAPIAFVGPSPMGIAATSETWQMNFLLDPAPIGASRLPVRLETVNDTVRVLGVQVF